jgi:hypothetical protein
MKKFLKWIALSSVLLFYAFLYIATTKTVPCDALCEKIGQVSQELSTGRPYIYITYTCTANTLCVFVNDSIQRNWNALADTACIYLKNKSINSYGVSVIGRFRDTLAKTKCP